MSWPQKSECHFCSTVLAEMITKVYLGSRGKGLDPPLDGRSADITL